jgi:hypothetical protein
MNRRVSIIVLSSLLIAIGVSDARAQQLPVFVMTVIETPPRATAQQLAGAIGVAQERMFALASALRKEHGDKRQNWPPEAVDAVHVAENTYSLAIARRDYQPADARVALDSIVEHLVREIAKSKVMAPAATRDGAALILEVVGRRIAETTGVTDARYFFRLRIRPGPTMTEARLREASAQYRWGPDFLTKDFARPTAAAAYWDVEIGSNASYKTAAAIARGVLENFVRSTALSAGR